MGASYQLDLDAFYKLVDEFTMATFKKNKISVKKGDSFPTSILKGFFHGSSGDTVRLCPVPIEEIFETEAKLIGMGAHRAKEREKEYGQYVSRLADVVRKEYGEMDIETIGKRLGYGTGSTTMASIERKWLEKVILAFRKLGTHYHSGTKLIEAIAINKFNCYASSAVIASALYELNVPAGIVTAIGIAGMSGHVVTRTQRHLVETVLKQNPIRDYDRMELQYKIAHEVSVNDLPGVTWYNHGMKMARRGQVKEAVEAFGKALEIMPGNLVVEFERANILRDYTSIGSWYR
jgi:hypothetical protein